MYHDDAKISSGGLYLVDKDWWYSRRNSVDHNDREWNGERISSIEDLTPDVITFVQRIQKKHVLKNLKYYLHKKSALFDTIHYTGIVHYYMTGVRYVVLSVTDLKVQDCTKSLPMVDCLYNDGCLNNDTPILVTYEDGPYILCCDNADIDCIHPVGKEYPLRELPSDTQSDLIAVQILDKEHDDGSGVLIYSVRQSRWDRICNLYTLVHSGCIGLKHKVISKHVTSDQQLLIDNICSPSEIDKYLKPLFHELNQEKKSRMCAMLK